VEVRARPIPSRARRVDVDGVIRRARRFIPSPSVVARRFFSLY
jgi:hypothetical protein